jgi:hypothetical protein
VNAFFDVGIYAGTVNEIGDILFVFNGCESLGGQPMKSIAYMSKPKPELLSGRNGSRESFLNPGRCGSRIKHQTYLQESAISSVITGLS